MSQLPCVQQVHSVLITLVSQHVHNVPITLCSAGVQCPNYLMFQQVHNVLITLCSSRCTITLCSSMMAVSTLRQVSTPSSSRGRCKGKSTSPKRVESGKANNSGACRSLGNTFTWNIQRQPLVLDFECMLVWTRLGIFMWLSYSLAKSTIRPAIPFLVCLCISQVEVYMVSCSRSRRSPCK